ncbi:MAG: T9SS type A sorting domain-containing protein [Chitinophagales bacterium]|nr:T9SS type A sorting domain-containing protein [Chitinophagales bacterium]
MFRWWLFTLICCCSASTFAGNGKIQFINNAPDSSFISADFYIGDSLLADNLKFRGATAFLDYPYDTTLTIKVVPKENAAAFTLTFENANFDLDSTYVIIASGLGDPSGYDAHPEGYNTSAKINFFTIPSISNINEDTVSLYFFHGGTDLANVQIKPSLSLPLIDTLRYNELSAQKNMEAVTYAMDVRSVGGSVLLSTFKLKTDSIGGQNLVVFLSGFLVPGTNKNGPNLSAFAAFEDGKVFELANITLVKNNISPVKELRIFPNPANDFVQVGFYAEKGTILQTQLIDIQGNIMEELPFTFYPTGKNRVSFNINNYASGMYFIQIKDMNGQLQSSQLIISK